MLETLLGWDTMLFRLINHARCYAADCIMSFFSSHLTIGIFVVAIALFVMWQKKWQKWYVYIILTALCFLLADRISVMCFKDVFCRLRPSHALLDAVTVKFSHFHLIYDNKGGQYGFVSSHAANIFTVVTLFSLIMRKERRGKWFIALAYLWAITVAYSRVYCGYHYPGDVLCGALLGVILAIILYIFYIKVLNKDRKNPNTIQQP